MNYLKEKWQIIVIVLLVLFGMNKCVNSCTNENKYKDAVKTSTELVSQKDSIINIYNDSIKTLNTKILILEATISGNKEMINRLAQANEQISSAKKNINVNVKSK